MNIGRKKLKLLPDLDSAKERFVRQQYVMEIKEIPDEKLFFIDETGFDLHTSDSYSDSPVLLPAIRKVSVQTKKYLYDRSHIE